MKLSVHIKRCVASVLWVVALLCLSNDATAETTILVNMGTADVTQSGVTWNNITTSTGNLSLNNTNGTASGLTYTGFSSTPTQFGNDTRYTASATLATHSLSWVSSLTTTELDDLATNIKGNGGNAIFDMTGMSAFDGRNIRIEIIATYNGTGNRHGDYKVNGNFTTLNSVSTPGYKASDNFDNGNSNLNWMYWDVTWGETGYTGDTLSILFARVDNTTVINAFAIHIADATPQPPIAAADTATIIVDTATNLYVRANDTLADGIKSVVGPATNAAGEAVMGTLDFTPGNDYITFTSTGTLGNAYFSYVVTNASGSATGQVTVTVLDPDAPLKIDFNDVGAPTLTQSGYTALTKVGGDVSYANAVGGTLTIATTSLDRDDRDRGALTSGPGLAQSDLLRDFYFRNGGTGTILTFSTLKTGTYTFTGFFHDNDVQQGAGKLGVDVGDGGGEVTKVASFTYSTGTAPASVGTASFEFTADGVNDVDVYLRSVSGSVPYVINGFTLESASIGISAADDTATTTSDTATNINVLANDLGDDLVIDSVDATATNASGTTLGTVSYTAPNTYATFTPNGTEGDALFSYVITNASGSATGRVTVTVQDIPTEIVAEFTDGEGSASVDQYPGIAHDYAGFGWREGWQTIGSFTKSVVSTTPLNGGGNYLSATAVGATEGFVRQFGDFGDVDITSDSYTMSLLLRIDSATVDGMMFGMRANEGIGTTTDVYWWFRVDSGDWTINNAGSATRVNTGIAATQGHVVHALVTINPAVDTYSVVFDDLDDEAAAYSSAVWPMRNTSAPSLARIFIGPQNGSTVPAFSVDGIHFPGQAISKGTLFLFR